MGDNNALSPAELRTINEINKLIGPSPDKIYRIRMLYEEYMEKVRDLERKLSLDSPVHQPSAESASKMVNDVIEELEICDSEMSDVLQEVREHIAQSKKLYLPMKEKVDLLIEMQKQYAYYHRLQQIWQFNVSLKEHFANKLPVAQALPHFNGLTELNRSLIGTSCLNLMSYLKKTIIYWNKFMTNKFSDIFKKSMEAVHWPIITGQSILKTTSEEDHKHFQLNVACLLALRIPFEPDSQRRFSRLSPPIEELIKPLKKRFIYHFQSSRPTNRLDKPEWYFTAILTWIRDHENFISGTIEPIYNEAGISAFVEFMCALVQIAVDKLEKDLEQIKYDDTLFSHVVDEILSFEKELRNSYNYPSSCFGPLSLLTEPILYLKWLRIEKKCNITFLIILNHIVLDAIEKMDSIMTSDTAWNEIPGVGDEEKVTEAACAFLALINSINERFIVLGKLSCRLPFVELQLELIEDFRVAILQVLHADSEDPLNSKLPQLINTVHHVKLAIEQYDASPNILLLEHLKRQQGCLVKEDKNENLGGLFQEPINLFDQLEKKFLNELCDALMMEVKARSRPYRKDKWHVMQKDDLDPTMVTLSACSMFQSLADNLHLMHSKLSPKIFLSYWKKVAKIFTHFIIEELILENHFSAYGGKVLKKDVSKYLLPIFLFYSNTPQSSFLELEDAATLLSLDVVPVEVKDAVIEGKKNVLVNELGCFAKNLSPQQILTVLKKRVDIGLVLV